MTLHPYQARPTANTHVWLTPPDLLRKLGAFDLDPCAAMEPRPWPTATQHIAPPENGLLVPWCGRVWLNPPYGPHAAKWLARLAEHDNGVALTFARTETRMFHQHVWPHADALLFLKSRPNFHHQDGARAAGNCGGPMCLIAYGRENVIALKRSGIAGALVMTLHHEAAA